MLHFITLSSDAPAASRQRFICSRTSSVWRSIGAARILPVCGSNGGKPETKIMLPARVTGDAGGAPHLSSQEEIGSTRRASRFMRHLRLADRRRKPNVVRHDHASKMIEMSLFRLDDLLRLQCLDLGVVIANRRQHFPGVCAEQRRRAIVLYRRAG